MYMLVFLVIATRWVIPGKNTSSEFQAVPPSPPLLVQYLSFSWNNTPPPLLEQYPFFYWALPRLPHLIGAVPPPHCWAVPLSSTEQ